MILLSNFSERLSDQPTVALVVFRILHHTTDLILNLVIVF